MPYLVENIGTFKVERGVFGRASSADVRTKLDFGFVCEIGSEIEVWLFNRRVFSGVLRRKVEKINGVEIHAIGNEDVLYRIYDRGVIKPIDVGESGEDMDISKVVEYLISKYTDFDYVYGTTIEETGVTIKKFVLNEYLANALDRIAKAVGFVWYVDGNTFYFMRPRYANVDVELTNRNTYFEKWDIKSDRLVNDLSLIGGQLEYIKSDFFRGDGVTKEFPLTYVPSGNVRVFVDGRELSTDEYEIDRDVPKVVFAEAPPYYDITGDEITQAYSGWVWRRKITVSIDASATPSSMNNPVFLVKIGDNELDWQNVKSDYSDVRFVITNGSTVTELPHVYLGRRQDGNEFYRYFAVKYNGTVNAGSSVDIYMLYGNPDCEPPSYDYEDVLIKYDEFNYDGWLPDALWTKIKSVKGYNRNPDCDNLTYVQDLPEALIAEAYAMSSVGGYVTLYARIDQVYGGVDVTAGTYTVESNEYDDNTYWIYWTEEGFPHVMKGSKVSISVDVSLSDFCPYQNENTVTLLRGVYYFAGWSIDPTITIGNRQLNSTYSVEVRYVFRSPIFVRVSDRESQNEYGLFSKVIRADWITDWSMAYTMALKYLSVYKEPLYENNVKIPLPRYLTYGLRPGDIVYVNDAKQGVSGRLVIYKEELRNDFAKLNIGSVTFDVFEWGAKVEERIRQLETIGDENFFTP